MSDAFKKCIDITPNGVLAPGSRQDYLWLQTQEWWEELLIDTRCVRLWIDRPSLQGDVANYALGAAPDGTIEALRLRNLDAQIRAANADGLEVILLPYRYPWAANGTLSLPVENLLFEPEDRVGGSGYLAWYYNRNAATPNPKDLRYRLPPDGHGPDSQWGRFVRAMFERWVVRSDVHGRADAIDVVNEPNGQLWPQRGPAADTSTIEARFEVRPAPPYTVNPPTSAMTVHLAVAEMMQTVDEYARSYSPRVRCFAPSTADSDVTANGSHRFTSKFASTPYSLTPSDAFAPRLLDELDRIGFQGGDHWCWSFHNYNDWERGQDRASALRPLLAGRWRGLTDESGPVLAATEGGCRLMRVPTRFPGATSGQALLDGHAQIVSEGIQRFAEDFGVGAGVRLLTHYTVCADPKFDDGLRDELGGERPAWRWWCLPFHRIGA